jgi:FkbM family methyltransferase
MLMGNKFYSQVGQDKWVCEYFNYKRDGYFLDIGAADGIDLSNTYYLEKELGWIGICVEALKKNFDKLQVNRNCISVHKAAYHKNTWVNFLGDGNDNLGGHISTNSTYTETVEAVKVEDILKEYNSPKIIDYISLDIEGNEYEALLGFPFKDYEVILWTIEHNLMGDQVEEYLKLIY